MMQQQQQQQAQQQQQQQQRANLNNPQQANQVIYTTTTIVATRSFIDVKIICFSVTQCSAHDAPGTAEQQSRLATPTSTTGNTMHSTN